uniref:F-box/LRR-repeat protein n=1 Tax=Strongyloides papillosus TaxID=174720 RepID=A0A0N5C2A8_STREA
MPRNVEVLQLMRVPNMNDATAKMITKHMPDIRLLNIECLSYRESDSLDNFRNLECLISDSFCPVRIPKTLKLFAFTRHFSLFRQRNLSSIDNLIKSHCEKFTKHITDGKIDTYYLMIFITGINTYVPFGSIFAENTNI